MSSEEPSGSLPSPSTSTAPQILKPLKIIRRNVLKSKGLTNCIQSLWSDHQKTSISPEILCNLPIHNIDVIFLDKTPMKIEYVFDPTRRNRENVFVKVDCLLPLFGEAEPSTTEGFASIADLCYFIKKKVNLDRCENFRHAACPCHLMRKDQELPDVVVKTSMDTCKHQHFHHFCWKHVVSWLYNYLKLLILLQESKQHFDEEIAYLYAMFPDDIVYFRTGKRTTPEFLFKTALEIDAAIYQSDYEQ